MSNPDHAAALALLDKITPGPWAARLNGSKTAYYIKGSDGVHVGGMSWHATDRRYYTLQDESRINARAIAALPELAALYRAGVELEAIQRRTTLGMGNAEAAVFVAHVVRVNETFRAALAAVADKLTKGE